MQSEKLIKVTKADGSSTIVPAGQKSIYEGFNARAKKLNKPKELVTIEDYEEAAEAKTAELGGGSSASAARKAGEVISDISNAKTKEEVAALVVNETRATVLKAAEAKTAELEK